MRTLLAAAGILAGLLSTTAAAEPAFIPCEPIALDARNMAYGRDIGKPKAAAVAEIKRMLNDGKLKDIMLHVADEVYANPKVPPYAVYYRVMEACGVDTARSNAIGW